MNRSIRLAVAGAIALTAVTIGVTSASAKIVNPAPAVPGRAAAVSPQVTPFTSPRPPTRGESVYVPITPCRIVDTRLAGGILHDQSYRTYNVGGTTGFTAQGGHNGGCGIPVGATAISTNLTAVSASSAGLMRLWPTGKTQPAAPLLIYQAHVSTGNGATLTINPTSASALHVENYTGTTHLVIDVTGYYDQQIEGMIDGQNAAIYAGSARLQSVTRNGIGSYLVKVDTDVSYCTPTVTAYQQYVYASASDFDGQWVSIFIWYLNSTTHAVTPYDGFVYLNVSC